MHYIQKDDATKLIFMEGRGFQLFYMYFKKTISMSYQVEHIQIFFSQWFCYVVENNV